LNCRIKALPVYCILYDATAGWACDVR